MESWQDKVVNSLRELRLPRPHPRRRCFWRSQHSASLHCPRSIAKSPLIYADGLVEMARGRPGRNSDDRIVEIDSHTLALGGDDEADTLMSEPPAKQQGFCSDTARVSIRHTLDSEGSPCQHILAAGRLGISSISWQNRSRAGTRASVAPRIMKTQSMAL